MPSPVAKDQRHNQLNHRERERQRRRETGRERNEELETEKKTVATKLEKVEEAEKGGMLSLKAFIKILSTANTPAGIDLVCLPFPPLWILHFLRNRKGYN